MKNESWSWAVVYTTSVLYTTTLLYTTTVLYTTNTLYTTMYWSTAWSEETNIKFSKYVESKINEDNMQT